MPEIILWVFWVRHEKRPKEWLKYYAAGFVHEMHHEVMDSIEDFWDHPDYGKVLDYEIESCDRATTHGFVHHIGE